MLTSSGTTDTCTYSTAGTEETFSVPAGVSALDVSAVGAAGGPGGGAAGSGAIVQNTALPVPAGVTELWVDVAGGSWPDGGNAGGHGFTGAGGGSSAVSTAPRAGATLTGDSATDSRLLVAGGGGGAASESEAGGGSAGDTGVTGGGNGGCYSIYTPGNGGVGPTDGTDGSGQAPDGCDRGQATSGSSAGGGNGDTQNNGWGAGGGGGWFGGGGSTLYAAGGGGSSYGGAGSGTVTIATAASTSVAPEVTISYTLPTPSISTSERPGSAAPGGKLADEASVTGGVSPTGTVTFELFSNSSCAGTALLTDTENLSGGAATSTPYTTTVPGTFYWVATYNGDPNNNAVSSSCSGEPVVVSLPPPSGAGTTIAKPGAPTDVTATGGNGSTTVSWAPPSDGGTMITSYSATAEPGAKTCTTTTNTCVIVGLANGTTYTVYVTATNAAGTGPAAHTASVMHGAFSLVWHRQRLTGTIDVELQLPGPGTVSLLGTHSDPATTASAAQAQLAPGPDRFAYGRRSDITITKAGLAHLALRPDPTGERLLRRHAAYRIALHVRVWISYTPTGGAATLISRTVRVLGAQQ